MAVSSRSAGPFDTVIVGCGAAGAILAARLSEDPSRSVCVIEAGRDYATVAELPDGIRTHRSLRGHATTAHRNANDPDVLGFPDWGLTARSNDLQRTIPVPRGKVVGGSSSVNGGVFLWGLRNDLDEWAAAGNPDWTFDACLPYFKKLESDADFASEHHGSSGPIRVHHALPSDWVPLSQAFHAACVGLGYPDCPDLNQPDAWGVGANPVNLHDGVRWSSAIGYLMPAHGRANLTVLSQARALRLQTTDLRVTGVEIEHDGVVSVVEGAEIILAAGAVGSPHLLMLSGVGPSAQIEAAGLTTLLDLPGVGQNLRDHPVLSASWGATEVLLPTSGPGMPGQLGLRATTPGSDDLYDMRLISFRAEGPHRFGIPFSLMHARSAGELRLTTADPMVPPSIDFRHLDSPADVQRLSAMLRAAIAVIDHPAFDGLRTVMLEPGPAVLDSEERLRDWMLSTLITGHHISGTCKMGPATDPLAVVDQQGRVHGITGLRVVDSSIMVDCPGVNINATTMMIAEKVAGLLRN